MKAPLAVRKTHTRLTHSNMPKFRGKGGIRVVTAVNANNF